MQASSRSPGRGSATAVPDVRDDRRVNRRGTPPNRESSLRRAVGLRAQATGFKRDGCAFRVGNRGSPRTTQPHPIWHGACDSPGQSLEQNSPVIEPLTLFLHDQPVLCLFLTILLGTIIGRFHFKGVGFGSVVGTLIAGIAIGILARPELPELLRWSFFYLFLFSIGYAVGPQFFGSLKKEALPQIVLALVVAVTGLADRDRRQRGLRVRRRACGRHPVGRDDAVGRARDRPERDRRAADCRGIEGDPRRARPAGRRHHLWIRRPRPDSVPHLARSTDARAPT